MSRYLDISSSDLASLRLEINCSENSFGSYLTFSSLFRVLTRLPANVGSSAFPVAISDTAVLNHKTTQVMMMQVQSSICAYKAHHKSHVVDHVKLTQSRASERRVFSIQLQCLSGSSSFPRQGAVYGQSLCLYMFVRKFTLQHRA